MCLGPDHVRKGYGRQILNYLIQYCKKELGAEEFIHLAREENEASHRLAKSMGFRMIDSELCVDKRDGSQYKLMKYSLNL
ncbi:MAG: GNAT family N-acetyltransferase [Lachnospiraceae bacterium]|nr:GNAT family N-acetyltransferase [Lachnospiraceae bacterium]